MKLQHSAISFYFLFFQTAHQNHGTLSTRLKLILFYFTGLIALVFSCWSKHSSARDWNGAMVKGRIAFWFDVLGIVITCLAVLAFVLIFYTRDTASWKYFQCVYICIIVNIHFYVDHKFSHFLGFKDIWYGRWCQMNMVNMYHDISFQCFVGFMFYKLVYEIGNGRIRISPKNYTMNPYAYKTLKIGQL